MEWMVTVGPSRLAALGKANCNRPSTCLSVVSTGHGYLSLNYTDAETVVEQGTVSHIPSCTKGC